MLFPLCCFPSEICTPRCPSPRAHQCHDMFVRPVKALGLEASQATSFLLNASPTLPSNLQQPRPNFISLCHSTRDKSVGFIMLGLVLLSVRTFPLSVVDRPSRKHCCQSNELAASISPNPCLSANGSKRTAPAQESSSPAAAGKCGPPAQDRTWSWFIIL